VTLLVTRYHLELNILNYRKLRNELQTSAFKTLQSEKWRCNQLPVFVVCPVKLIIAQPVKSLSALYETQMLIIVSKASLPMVSITNQINPKHSLSPHFNITLPANELYPELHMSRLQLHVLFL
jgi:hypothetical protein